MDKSYLFLVACLITVISLNGCSSAGDPMDTAKAFMQAICNNDLDEANKYVVFEERMDSNSLSQVEQSIAGELAGIPGGSGLMRHMYPNSSFELMEHTNATARVMWTVDMGGLIEDIVGELGGDKSRIPSSAMPGEYQILIVAMEKRGGKWRIMEIIEVYKSVPD